MARLGLAKQFECVFANDFDAKKCAAYRANFGDADLREQDIASLTVEGIPNADLAWASFPCQDLSLAGTRSGMTGERSGTFWAFWDLILGMQRERCAPKIIVLENVTGLLTSRKGADFSALVSALSAAGYKVGAAVLDAADFVPQSRPRLFVVAFDPSCHRPEGAPATLHPMLDRAVQQLPAAAQSAWHPLPLPLPQGRSADLAAIIETDVPSRAWRSQADLVKLLNLMAPLHRARVDAAVAAGELRVGAVYRRIRGGQQRAEVRYDGLAGCIRTLKGGSSRQLFLISQDGDLRLRPMRPREAARLMGLPEDYQLPKSETAAISLCGDGLCVPAVAWLSRHILAPLLQQTPETEHFVLQIGAD